MTIAPATNGHGHKNRAPGVHRHASVGSSSGCDRIERATTISSTPRMTVAAGNHPVQSEVVDAPEQQQHADGDEQQPERERDRGRRDDGSWQLELHLRGPDLDRAQAGFEIQDELRAIAVDDLPRLEVRALLELSEDPHLTSADRGIELEPGVVGEEHVQLTECDARADLDRLTGVLDPGQIQVDLAARRGGIRR